MKLFKKNKFAWTEPWFFCQRIRDRSEWLRAVLPAVATGTLITGLLFARGPNLQWWQIVLLGLATAAVIQFGIEAAYMRRDISIDEESLEAFGNAGQITSYANHPLPQILSIELRRGEEIGFPFAMLVLRMADRGNVIGIPSSIRLERLAYTLHQLNVPVTLSGWEPAPDSDWHQNEYIQVAPNGAVLQVAQIESIPEVDRNLTKLPDMLIALMFAAWLVLVWLGLLAWIGIYLFQNRQTLGIWVILCSAIAMFASLTIPFGYFAIFGDYFSATYLIRVAQGRIKGRGESLIKSFDGDVFAVELIERETWDKMAPKVIDFGFLRVEPDRERILYEGNLERWIVPFSSVKVCKVEEVQYGTGGESVAGELRCYVVLVFQKASGPYEIGLRVADKEIGKNTDARRMRKAVELFEFLVQGFSRLS